MPTEDHWIISMLFFSDICRESMKNGAINLKSDNIFWNLTIRPVLELIRSVKALCLTCC